MSDKKLAQLAVRIPTEEMDEFRRAVLHMQRVDPRVSMTDLVRSGLTLIIEMIEKEHGPIKSVEASPVLRVGRRSA